MSADRSSAEADGLASELLGMICDYQCAFQSAALFPPLHHLDSPRFRSHLRNKWFMVAGSRVVLYNAQRLALKSTVIETCYPSAFFSSPRGKGKDKKDHTGQTPPWQYRYFPVDLRFWLWVLKLNYVFISLNAVYGVKHILQFISMSHKHKFMVYRTHI